MAEENINNEQSAFELKGTGAVAGAAGILGILQNLSQSVSQILSSPAGSFGAFYTLGHVIENQLNKKLREGVKLNKEQEVEFNNYLKYARNVTLLAGAFSALTNKITQSTIELRKNALELRGYSSLSQMPGGSGDYKSGARSMMGNEIWNTLSYTGDIAEQITSMKKKLNMRLNTGLGYNEATKDKYIEDLVMYSQTLGTDVSEFTDMDRARYNMKPGEEKKILDSIMYGFKNNKFGQLGNLETLNLYRGGIETAIQSSVPGELAKYQIMNFLQNSQLTSSGKMKDLNSDGVKDLMNFALKFQTGEMSPVFQAFTGKKLPTGENAIEQTLNILSDFVQKNKGMDNKSLASLFETDISKYAQRKITMESLGVGNDIFQYLRGEKFSEKEQGLTTELKNMINNNTLIGTNKEIDNFKNELQKATKELTTLSDWFRAAGKGTNYGMSAAGEFIDNQITGMGGPSGVGLPLLQLLGMGGAGALTYGVGKRMGSNLLKKFMEQNSKLLSTILESGTPVGGLRPASFDQVGSKLGAEVLEKTGEKTAIRLGEKTALKTGKGVLGKTLGKVALPLDLLISGLLKHEENPDLSWHEATSRGFLEGIGDMASIFDPAFMWKKQIQEGIKDKHGKVVDVGLAGDIISRQLPNLFYGEEKIKNRKELSGTNKEDLMSTTDESKTIPKIKVMIVDSRDTKLAEKTVKTDGQEMIRVTMSGVLGL